MKKESRFNTIFELTARGFSVINSRNGQLVEVNQKFCDMFGLKKDEVSATTFMEITHPDDLQADLDNMQRLIDGEVREFSMEKRYIHNDGSLVWGHLTVAALWDVGEEPDYHLAIVEDITMRKRAEEKLKHANDLLEQRVEQRTARLKDKTRVLNEKETELKEKNTTLVELNTALKVLVQQKNVDRVELEEQLIASMKLLIAPYVSKLVKICPDTRQQNLIKIINENLKEIISPFSRKLSSGYANLTATEIRVANLIKKAYSNKAIAESLNISSQTVAFHRKKIRKKLGITNTNKNLAYYLESLE
jgi:PAS domain S-box-containing protein